MIHVYPLNDLYKHDTENGSSCRCGPNVLWKDPETGESYVEALVVHRAEDHREIIEQAEAIIQGSK